MTTEFKLEVPSDVSTHVLWKYLVDYLNSNIHLLGGGTALWVKDTTTRYTENPQMAVIRRVRVIDGALDTTQIIPYQDALNMSEGVVQIDEIVGLRAELNTIKSRLTALENK